MSGEALMSDGEQYSHRQLTDIAQAIGQVVQMGVQVGIVVGAGNVFRARSANLQIVDRVTADNVGMLGTIMNAAIMRDYLRAEGLKAKILSPREQSPLTRSFARDDALALFQAGNILLFAGGTGNPYFTTDTAATLRAMVSGRPFMWRASLMRRQASSGSLGPRSRVRISSHSASAHGTRSRSSSWSTSRSWISSRSATSLAA